MTRRKQKKLKVKLDAKSIQEAIDEVRRYQAGVELVCKEIAQIVGELGVEIAQAKLIEYGAFDEGTLHDSIHYAIDEADGKARVYIRADAEHALYVEFGTGIVGKDSPKHPMHNEAGWKHDVNNHGYKGWVYKDENGETHHTWGQPARPFLYEAVLELEKNIPEIVRKVFK